MFSTEILSWANSIWTVRAPSYTTETWLINPLNLDCKDSVISRRILEIQWTEFYESSRERRSVEVALLRLIKSWLADLPCDDNIVCSLGPGSRRRQCYLFPTWDAIARSLLPLEATNTMHFALPIRANWSTKDASKSADIKRCARSRPDYLEPKGLPCGVEGTQLNGICDSRIQTHDLNTEDISCKQGACVRVQATTPLKPRGENGLAVIQILQVIMTIANIEWLNLTFKRRRRLTETFCAVFWWWHKGFLWDFIDLYPHKKPTHPNPDPRSYYKTKLYRCELKNRLLLTGWAIIVRCSCRKVSPKGSWRNKVLSSFWSPNGLR